MDTCKVKDSLALSDACDLVSYHVVSRYLKLKSYPQIFSNKRKQSSHKCCRFMADGKNLLAPAALKKHIVHTYEFIE